MKIMYCYDGPCEVVRIRVPDDAKPGDLIEVPLPETTLTTGTLGGVPVHWRRETFDQHRRGIWKMLSPKSAMYLVHEDGKRLTHFPYIEGSPCSHL